MKHLKQFENNNKKFALIAYDILDNILVCEINKSKYDHKYIFQKIENIDLNNVRKFNSKEILTAKLNLTSFSNVGLYNNLTFNKMTIDELEMLLNTNKYNL